MMWPKFTSSPLREALSIKATQDIHTVASLYNGTSN